MNTLNNVSYAHLRIHPDHQYEAKSLNGAGELLPVGSPSCFKLTLLTSLIFFILSQEVVAAPPIAFGGWAAGAGGVSAPCPASFECIVSVSDTDILQRTLRAANGDEYIQLIVTGQAVDGTSLIDESFIRINGGQGISLQQTMAQSGVDQFNAQTVLNLGWANTGGGPAIDITQTLISNSQGATLTDTFSYSVDQDVNGNVIGTFTDVTQVLTNAAGFSNITPTGQDIQKFVFRRATGVRNPSAGSATLGGAMGGMGGGGMGGGGGGMGGGMMGGGNGGTLSWNVNDDLQIVWIASICEGCGNGGGMGGGGGGGMGGGGMGGGSFGANFSYQALDNLSDAITPIATASIVSTNPFIWPDPPFGAQPTIP